MSDNETRVTDWIRSGMDYNEGIKLLGELTHIQGFTDQFYGRERYMSNKLAYEICKAAQVADHVTWKEYIENVKYGRKVKGKKRESKNSFGKLPEVKAGKENELRISNSMLAPMVPEVETLETKPLFEYPTVIRRVVYEYASLFQERSKLHAVMTEMPESNADAVCAKRAEMFDMIKTMSELLGVYFEIKKAFDETGKIPAEEDVFPTEKKEEEKPDIRLLDEVSLKKQKKNLQSSNSKDQALLDYQSKERTEVKKPMPSGPKRTKIEARMKDRNKQIEEIDTQLLQYVVKS